MSASPFAFAQAAPAEAVVPLTVAELRAEIDAAHARGQWWSAGGYAASGFPTDRRDSVRLSTPSVVTDTACPQCGCARWVPYEREEMAGRPGWPELVVHRRSLCRDCAYETTWVIEEEAS